MHIDEDGSLPGWPWTFTMERIITCIVGWMAYHALVNLPVQAIHTMKDLPDRNEYLFIHQWIVYNRNNAIPVESSFRRWISSWTHSKVQGFAMISFCIMTLSYSIAYFLPIILHGDMGFDISTAQCLVAPPYIFAAIIIWLSAWVGDKYHIRGPILVMNLVIGLIGLPVMWFAPNSIARYVGTFLVTAGASANIPASWAHQMNNIRGQWKRALCSTTLIGFAGIGGIAGGLVFRGHHASKYLPGIYATMGCSVLITFIVVIQMWYFRGGSSKTDREGKALKESVDRYTTRDIRWEL